MENPCATTEGGTLYFWDAENGESGGHDCAREEGHKGPHGCADPCPKTWTDAEGRASLAAKLKYDEALEAFKGYLP